ncbi:hypothetical protein F7P74_06195 [Helicobacter pullorum NCTC 12824]|uniref:hypothetical protein n=1 Tax=Helicobacter pullorum TaxID=35818 RepID=UPI0012474889|nr:hypothetical protein [Helicobacter pullorum]KAB0574521.1 hypothetical protein F7P74_06195 [Helicobacter pullorum NCTC 12824]
MRIEFNEEILEYCYKENTEAKGFLTSCREILIPYMLKKHKNSLKEYISLGDIELINTFRTVEIKVFNTDRAIKIDKATFKNIEKELIQPLYNSLKNLNLKYALKIGCYLYINVKGESRFSSCWKELKISDYGYQARFVCPSLDMY